MTSDEFRTFARRVALDLDNAAHSRAYTLHALSGIISTLDAIAAAQFSGAASAAETHDAILALADRVADTLFQLGDVPPPKAA